LSGTWYYRVIGYSAALACIWFSFFIPLNVSPTPFIVLLYAVVLGFSSLRAWREKNDDELHLGQVLAFAPSLLILIPYPNYAYHIGALFYCLLCALKPSMHYDSTSIAWRAGALLIVALLMAAVLRDEYRRVNSMPTYVVGQLKFRSADERWLKEIDAAKAAASAGTACESNGCAYLLQFVAHGAQGRTVAP
jgi:hypothetical protein